MKHWYKNLKDSYSSMPKDEQILHMVSDLTRAKNMDSVDRSSAKDNLYRAIILLDYIIADPKWLPKLRELLRLREAIGSLIVDQQPFGNIDQVITAALLMEPKAYKALKK